MKNLLLIIATISCIAFVGLRNSHKSDVDLKLSEDKNKMSISAKFPDDKTPEVQSYLTEELGDSNEMSFENGTIDGEIGLNDGSYFYMKLAEGRLKIEMERKRNSQTAYKRLKKMFEGLKTVLTSN
ncbi:hypothetical protein [Lacihabitans soyangensis]|uniref:Uncharacterized protein n=1 Tax=Lacihabitans soyangensis TaxID=869394 RepID=A0AAE3KV15_9BACT|nr:hypothetical protein [Lacihabitans soyangensis]MCP9765563.1 hypothetical protein [Lacihabitans soyangensis]